ncbi:DNA polymerase X family [Schizosaccharomyces pombe]|uniref:DNA polymerase type-X family protein pol4 n=1 Tax=Schizosaccharomyces pombe (strain 972 / ATCC 24843) TaxID=284812 RepID=DPO4_SCHPO|nr:DNA polymerase X family [Schizosaccharomyces pombe]Q09693.1 RecName: Full=DNA polymerase type-X family protein pol4 [Schizosaccharomyces pombe 972h-]CAA90493.1 DNA polymerase X family [Schizosaccharomyces pombe]|eukprot:NP_592977.1 DNA polymerase X family [Schizosaccharomyces pombe]
MKILASSTNYVLHNRLSNSQYEDARSKIVNFGGEFTNDAAKADYIFVNYSQINRVRRELRTIGTPLETCVSCKLIVKIDWLNEPKESLTPGNPYVIWHRKPEMKVGSPYTPSTRPASHTEAPNDFENHETPNTENNNEVKSIDNVDQEGSVYPTTKEYPYVLEIPRYACQRKTPLKCVNQAFVNALSVLKTCREVNGESVRTRAYGMAIATIKAFPLPIDSAEQLEKMPGCGPKIVHLWKEFASTGTLKEAEEFQKDPASKILLLFYNIFGVGASHAAEWYQKGWRTIEQVRKHKDSFTKQIKVGLEFYEDFCKTVTIEEATEIYETIVSRMPDGIKIQSCLVGGFRRGKPVGADVDMVLSPSHTHSTKHLVDVLLRILDEEFQFRLISVQEHSCGGKKGYVMLAVILSNSSKINRRVDIIVVPPAYIGSAVLGWSGGIFFLRDLKLYANSHLGLSYDSFEIINLKTGKDICPDEFNEWKDPVEAEKDIFRYFSLEYIEPKFRNTG